MSQVENSPQLSTAELHRINFFLGVALCLVSIATIFYLEAAVFFHFVLTAGIVSVTFVWPKVRLAVPALVWKGAPAVILLLFLSDVVFRNDLLEALIRLNLLLLAFRCVSFRNRREDLQLILLCLFVIIIGGVLTVSVVFVLQVLLFTAIGMCFLFNINLLEGRRGGASPEEIWEDFRWRTILPRLWAAADLRFAGFSTFLFLSMVGLSSMIFLVLPRIDIDNRLSFRGLEQPGLTGFSDQIGLNDITNIQEDHRTALRIDPPARSREEIPAEPYWRMLALDEYDDGRFRVSDAASYFMLHHAGGSFTSHALRWRRLESEESRRQTDWHFYLEGGVARYLPRGGPFQEIRLSERNANLRNFHFSQVLALDSIKSNMFSYGLIGMQFSDRMPDPVFGRALRSQGGDEAGAPISRRSSSLSDEEIRNRMLGAMNELALSVPVRGADAAYLRGVVETIRDGEDLTPREFAGRAKDYLQSRHGYSLTSRVEPGRGDPVVRWMQQESEGHCEYFAAAMILLSRTAGYPARAVTGFFGGTWNPYEDYLMVRFSDAHAWVEIYDKDEGGGVWFRADATPPGRGLMFPSGIAQTSGWGLSVDSSLGAYLDSIRVLWYRQVVSFDEEGQEHFFAAVKSRITGWSDRFVEGVTFLWTSFIEGWKEGRGLWQILYMTAGAAVLAILYYALKGVAGQIFSLLFLGRGRTAADPVRRRAAAWLRRIARKQSRTTTAPAVPEEEVFVVQRKLQALRYGPHSRGAEAGSIFRAARSLVKRIR